MLENVKATIAALPDKSFTQHFQEYVMIVQDEHISSEIATLLKHNHLDVAVMSKVIQQNYERLIANDSK